MRPRLWPTSCIATWNHDPPYSLSPQSIVEFMIAWLPPSDARPPGPVVIVGSRARMSPVTIWMPRLSDSTKRMPVKRL